MVVKHITTRLKKDYNSPERNEEICGDCGGKKDQGQIRCEECFEKNEEKRTKLCRKCDKSISKKYEHCYDCLLEMPEHAAFRGGEEKRRIKCRECDTFGNFGKFNGMYHDNICRKPAQSNYLKRDSKICGNCGITETKQRHLAFCNDCRLKTREGHATCKIQDCYKSIFKKYKYCYECIKEKRGKARYTHHDQDRRVVCENCGELDKFVHFSGLHHYPECPTKKNDKSEWEMENDGIRVKKRNKMICGDCGGEKDEHFFRCHVCYKKETTKHSCKICGKDISVKFKHCYECLQEEWGIKLVSGEMQRTVVCENCGKRSNLGSCDELKCGSCGEAEAKPKKKHDKAQTAGVYAPVQMPGSSTFPGIDDFAYVSHGSTVIDLGAKELPDTKELTYRRYGDSDGSAVFKVSDQSVKFSPNPTKEKNEGEAKEDRFKKPAGYCQGCGIAVFKYDDNYQNFIIQGYCLKCPKQERSHTKSKACECLYQVAGDEVKVKRLCTKCSLLNLEKKEKQETLIKEKECETEMVAIEETPINPDGCTCRYEGNDGITSKGIDWTRLENISCLIHNKETKECETEMVAIEERRTKTKEEHIGFFVIGLIKASLVTLLIGLVVLFLPAIISLGFDIIVAGGQAIIDRTATLWEGRTDLPILYLMVLGLIGFASIWAFVIDWKYIKRNEAKSEKNDYDFGILPKEPPTPRRPKQ